ncbi:hypothetical protein P4O66_020742 [Electrophorus voltai]|uniref:Ig-like domain-containing protein n=1 Tax=Electrophorus voltai TaxID=2609070 RepID=A0AAD9E3Y7_9TELE|nr:hypothetical protein P4O66_020742 [Electrophorus voltai]
MMMMMMTMVMMMVVMMMTVLLDLWVYRLSHAGSFRAISQYCCPDIVQTSPSLMGSNGPSDPHWRLKVALQYLTREDPTGAGSIYLIKHLPVTSLCSSQTSLEMTKDSTSVETTYVRLTVSGCSLSENQQHVEISRSPGESVFLLCSCTDLQEEPVRMEWRLSHHEDLHSTELSHRYSGRVQSCTLSETPEEKLIKYPGESVLLPCSCTDHHTKPGTLKWEHLGSSTESTWAEVFNGTAHYTDRIQMFNQNNPANFSLLISNLTEEDHGTYRCTVNNNQSITISLSFKGCTLPETPEEKLIKYPGVCSPALLLSPGRPRGLGIVTVTLTSPCMTFLQGLSVSGWHDLDNSEYDCWPLEKPDDVNMIDCGGLEMAWVLRPPDKVLSGEDFNVIYSISVREEFYQWAVDNNIFVHRSITDAAEARRFCEEHECPTNWKDANGENCCIHHANIHSCPMGYMKAADERICGPWIPDDGRIFTHTISTSGKMTQTNWSARVVLFHEGLTSLIAHIRVGNMQAALEAKSTVLPMISTCVGTVCERKRRAVLYVLLTVGTALCVLCGDGVCEEEESCSLCPADCGDCPLSASVRAAVGLTITTIIISFFITAMWFRYQKQKLLWDESWIIDFNDIKQDYIARAAMGSIISVPAANSDSNASCVTALSSCTGMPNPRKQLYTHTGI